jgi:hypothetical protein
VSKTAIVLSVENLWDQSEERCDKVRYFFGVLYEGGHKNEAVLLEVQIAIIFEVVDQSANDAFKSAHQSAQHGRILP